MSEKILHTDIAEAGALKPLQDELIATIKILNTMEGDVKAVALAVKGMLASNKTDTLKDIDDLRKKTQQANEAFSAQENIIRQLKTANAKLAEVNSDISKELAAVNVELGRNNQLNKENAKLASDQTGAYEKASITLNKYRKAWKDLAIVNKENTAEAKALKTQIDQLDASLKRVDAATGQHQRNVGNYGGAIQGIRLQMNQLTREVPSTINNMSSMFLAFSNNLPMMADQIANLRKENELLKASGQKATPVWRALATSFFSFGTALSAGIALLTLYGAEVMNGIKSMLGFTVVTKEQKEALEEHKKMMENIAEEHAKQAISIETLTSVINDENVSLEIKKQAYRELQKLIPEISSLTYEQATSQDVLNAAVARQLRLIELKADFEIYQEQLIADRRQKLYEQRKSDEQKIIELEKEKLDINQREQLVKKDSSVIFTMYDVMRREQIEEEIALLKRSSAEKAAAVQAEILDIERLGQEAADALKERQRLLKNRKHEESELEKAAAKQRKAAEDLENEERNARLDENLEKQKLNNFKLAETEKDLDKELSKIFKKRKEEEKAKQELIQSATRLLQKSINERLAIQEKEAEKEIENSEKRQAALQELAIKGVQDASNTIAFEERKQAELEAKRIKQQKNQKRTELIFAGLKAYSANVERNPSGALAATLKDITALTTALSSLPTFFEGTENTGKGGDLDGKGGFAAVLHPNERVLTAEQNKKIGDLSNKELADLAALHRINMTSFDRVPMSAHVFDDRLITKTEAVADKIENLTKVIENRPVVHDRFDEVEKLVKHYSETKHKKETTVRRVGRYGR